MSSPSFTQQAFEQAVTWFVALQEVNVDQAQHAKFQRWLQQHESHAAAYAEAEQLWSSFDRIKTVNSIPGLSAARVAAPRSIRHSLASLLVCAVAIGWWLDYQAPIVSYATNIGERQSIELEDGSRIELDAASSLAVRLSWLRREVRLDKGQALFTIAHEQFRPFDVQTGALKIHDIGTRFEVGRTQQSTEVVVLEGSVELSTGQQVVQRLTVGQRRRMDQFNQLQTIEAIDLDKVGAWLNGRLIFDHTPLSEVIEEIERHHPVTFQFADASLATQTISGNFAAADLKPFLRSLESILPIHTKRHRQTIILSKR